jgi:hypothetical protein
MEFRDPLPSTDEAIIMSAHTALSAESARVTLREGSMQLSPLPTIVSLISSSPSQRGCDNHQGDGKSQWSRWQAGAGGKETPDAAKREKSLDGPKLTRKWVRCQHLISPFFISRSPLTPRPKEQNSLQIALSETVDFIAKVASQHRALVPLQHVPDFAFSKCRDDANCTLKRAGTPELQPVSLQATRSRTPQNTR